MPSHRKSSRLGATEIRINVYDLLPQGRLSSILWACGGSVLHSGVVINGKEYAYGGHAKRGMSGVFWTKPGVVPPGGTFRCEVLQGFSLLSAAEIDQIIRETSHRFQGPEWNLLTNNCNHFTSFLCEQLTGKPAPAWLNRAAAVGVALPCIVPRHWLVVPDAETADGELLEDEDEDEDEDDERAAMLTNKQFLQQRQRGDDVFELDDFPDRGEESESDVERRLRDKADRMSLSQTSREPVPVSNVLARPAS